MVDHSERIRAMLLGVAVGDALGWPHEVPRRVVGDLTLEGAFQRWRRRAGSRFWSYEEPLPPGTYSDDTQLMMACGRSLLQPDWFAHFVGKELPTWRLYERGGGRTVLRAADAWTMGTAPWRARRQVQSKYFESGANGAAMRIAPHAAIGSNLLHRVVADAIATHGHPRALLGAMMQAWALEAALGGALGDNTSAALEAALDHVDQWADFGLLDGLPASWRDAAGGEYETRWRDHSEQAVASLRIAHRWAQDGALAAESEVLRDLGATDKATNGAGDVCAVAALYLAARYASQPEQALRAAARQPGADTDTLASMVGALLGAMVGQDAVAAYPGVQDGETIERLADDLVVAQASPPQVVDELDPRPTLEVDQFTARLDEGASRVRLPDGRSADLVEQRRLSSSATQNEVMGHYLRCDDGQGLLAITRRKRTKNETARAEASTRSGDEQPVLARTLEATGPDADVTEVVAIPPDVDLSLRCRDPEQLVRLLECVGLYARADGDKWHVEDVPLTIARHDEAPRLEFEPSVVAVELIIHTPDLALACARLAEAGWHMGGDATARSIVEGGVAVRLVQETNRGRLT